MRSDKSSGGHALQKQQREPRRHLRILIWGMRFGTWKEQEMEPGSLRSFLNADVQCAEKAFISCPSAFWWLVSSPEVALQEQLGVSTGPGVSKGQSVCPSGLCRGGGTRCHLPKQRTPSQHSASFFSFWKHNQERKFISTAWGEKAKSLEFLGAAFWSDSLLVRWQARLKAVLSGRLAAAWLFKEWGAATFLRCACGKTGHLWGWRLCNHRGKQGGKQRRGS